MHVAVVWVGHEECGHTVGGRLGDRVGAGAADRQIGGAPRQSHVAEERHNGGVDPGRVVGGAHAGVAVVARQVKNLPAAKHVGMLARQRDHEVVEARGALRGAGDQEGRRAGIETERSTAVGAITRRQRLAAQGHAHHPIRKARHGGTRHRNRRQNLLAVAHQPPVGPARPHIQVHHRDRAPARSGRDHGGGRDETAQCDDPIDVRLAQELARRSHAAPESQREVLRCQRPQGR